MPDRNPQVDASEPLVELAPRQLLPRTLPLLRQVAVGAGAEYEAALADSGHSDLTGAQTRLLPLIGPSGSRLTEIALLGGHSKQAVSAIVDQLEELGYSERVADPLDRRAKLVRLTPKGWEALFMVHRVLDAIEFAWAEQLGEAGLRQLRDLLGALLARSAAGAATAEREARR